MTDLTAADAACLKEHIMVWASIEIYVITLVNVDYLHCSLYTAIVVVLVTYLTACM